MPLSIPILTQFTDAYRIFYEARTRLIFVWCCYGHIGNLYQLNMFDESMLFRGVFKVLSIRIITPVLVKKVPEGYQFHDIYHIICPKLD